MKKNFTVKLWLHYFFKIKYKIKINKKAFKYKKMFD